MQKDQKYEGFLEFVTLTNPFLRFPDVFQGSLSFLEPLQCFLVHPAYQTKSCACIFIPMTLVSFPA